MQYNSFEHANANKIISSKLNLSRIVLHCYLDKKCLRIFKLFLGLVLINCCLSCGGGSSKKNNDSETESQKRFELHSYAETPYLKYKDMQFTTLILKESNNKNNIPSFHGTAKLASDTISLLGTGYNSVTGELLASQVVVSPKISTDSNGGIQEQIIKATIATSYDELISSMEVSGSASLGFSVFSASAKMKTIHNIHTSSSSSYLVYQTSIKHFSKELTTPTFSSDTDVTDKLNNYGEFFGFAGDEYVYRETFGGDLYIIFAAEAHNKTEYEANSKAFNAATTFINLGGSANISQAITTIQGTSNMQMFLYQNGGEGFASDSSTATISEMFKYAQQFAKQVKGHSTLISYSTKQYQTAKNFPVGFQGSPQLREYKSYMNAIVRKLLKINSISKNIDFTSRNSILFSKGFADSVAKFNTPLSRQLDKLQDCANQCRSEYSLSNCSQCDALHYDSVNYNLVLPLNAPPVSSPTPVTSPSATVWPHFSKSASLAVRNRIVSATSSMPKM